jgi:CRP-like cAMP-binding protein
MITTSQPTRSETDLRSGSRGCPMNMTSPAQPRFAVAGAAPDQTFPRLPAETVDRVLRYGHPETFDGGAYLYQFGERGFDFFLVLDGTVDALDNDGKGGNIVLATYGAKQFSSELNLFSDRAALLSARARTWPGR